MKSKTVKIVIIAVATALCLALAFAAVQLLLRPTDNKPKADPPDPNGTPSAGVEVHPTLYFGGLRGYITLSATEQNMPQKAYAVIKALDKDAKEMYSFVTEIVNGQGDYDNRDKEKADCYQITLCQNEDGTVPLCEAQTVKMAGEAAPAVFITELSNRSTVQFKPNTGKQTQGQDVKTPLYQFVELHNYSETPVDMTKLRFVYTTEGKDTEFYWIPDSAALLNPDDTAVIAVYNQYAAAEGLGYETAEERAAYWKSFCEFYGVDIPAASRMMVACTKSGTDKPLDSITELSLEPSTARIETTEGVVMTQVDLPAVSPNHSYSYQFVPGGSNAEKEEFLFCTGAFPYQLLDEQNPAFVPTKTDESKTPLKVMSYNILADTHTTHTVELRRPILLQVLADYQPDTIGLQEVNEDWCMWLNDNVPANYSVVEGLSSKGNDYNSCNGTWDLLNPIYYRNDKFTLIDSGAAFLTPDGQKDTKQWDSNNLKRTMTWVVLEDKQTGERIAHVNAHLALSGYQSRIEQVKLMYQKGAELKQKYGCGITTTGDHNMAEGTVSYLTYQKSGVVKDAKYLTTHHQSIATCPDYFQHSDTYGVAIDYCFVSPDDYTVGRYNVVRTGLSDHYGIYVELYRK